MRKLCILLSIFFLYVAVGYSANRVTTWSSGQVLTHTALNAEFDNIYAGDISRTAGYWATNDNIPFYVGSSQDAQLEWETTQTNDALMLGLSGSLSFIVTEKADMATNYALSSRTDPAIIIHSADAGTANDYLELQHNQTDAVLNAGTGGFSLQAAGTEITDVTSVGDWVFKGTTPILTIGDADQEDAGIVLDGNAVDFYIALDDTADDLIIGTGSTIGSNARLTIDASGVTFNLPATAVNTFNANYDTTLGDGIDDKITLTGSIQGTNAAIFEGSSVDSIETIFAITNPTTADKTITFPNLTGTVALIGAASQTGTLDLSTVDAATSILLGGTNINTAGTLTNVAYENQANTFTLGQTINSTLAVTGATTLNTVAYTWPGSDGTDGYVLSTNGGGTLSWVSNAGGGATELNELTDVTISSPSTGHLLRYNGSTWVNVTPATAGLAELTGGTFTGHIGINSISYTWPSDDGDNGEVLTTNGTGTLSWAAGGGGASSLNDLTDVTITASSSGEILRHNGTAYVDTLPLLNHMDDVNITVASTNEILQYDGSDWVDKSLANAGIAQLSGATFTGNVLSSNGTQNVGASGTRFSTGYFTTLNASNTTINSVAYTWPGSDGTSGQVLSTNGSGTLSWDDAGTKIGDVKTSSGETATTSSGSWAAATVSVTSSGYIDEIMASTTQTDNDIGLSGYAVDVGINIDSGGEQVNEDLPDSGSKGSLDDVMTGYDASSTTSYATRRFGLGGARFETSFVIRFKQTTGVARPIYYVVRYREDQ
jgi:uncharacterized membrane protein